MKRVETRRQMLSWLWNEIPNEQRAKYPVEFPGYPSVEYVRAGDLRGMEGNEIHDWNKVEELRGQQYENAIIVDYNDLTGQAHVSEGNHRLMAAEDDQLVPVQVMRGRRKGLRSRQMIDPELLTDEHNYLPSYLYPSQIGLNTYPKP